MYAQDSQEATANLAAIEAKLGELDGVFLQFCSRQDYQFSRNCQIWPKRRVWRRQQIDRCMDLVMDVGFQEALDRGFYREMPWSFYARASLHPGTDPDIHILSRPIFEHVPYHQLASVLEDGLACGLRILTTMTKNEVRARGKTAQESLVEGHAEGESYRRSQKAARFP